LVVYNLSPMNWPNLMIASTVGSTTKHLLSSKMEGFVSSGRRLFVKRPMDKNFKMHSIWKILQGPLTDKHITSFVIVGCK
jgi:hypothetical protein